LGGAIAAAHNGDRISITQHTGDLTITAPAEDADAFANLLVDMFLATSPEELQLAFETYQAAGGELGLDGTADESDKNPTYFEKGDPSSINIVSVGSADFVDGMEVDPMVALLAFEQVDSRGDPTAEVLALATIPNDEEGVGDGFDYMSMVGWLALEQDNVTGLDGAPPRAGGPSGVEVVADFGVGHLGLATPLDADGHLPVGDVLASYDGPFVGFFVVPGSGGAEADPFGAGVATGDAMLTASFMDSTVVGTVDDIWTAGLNLANGEVIEEPLGARIDIDALISGNTYAGSATIVGDSGLLVDGSSGSANGAFYGPVTSVDGSTGPAETGVVLTVRDADGTGNFLTGVIGGQLAPAPDPI